jgi:tRNA-modifying protein YgfZ
MSADPLPFVADLSPNALIAVTGDEAGAFLHNQFTNDVLALAAGSAQWNGWCTPKGRLLATFPLVNSGTGYFMLLPAAIAESIVKRLRMFVLRSKVKLEDVSANTPRFGVYGVSESPATGAYQLGAQRWLVIGQGAPTLRQGTIEDWDRSLIADGIPTVVAATQEAFVPQMANFELIGGVSFKKGCYPGQEIVARTHYRGGLKRRMVRAHGDGAAPSPGESVFSTSFGEQAAGTIVNAALTPEGGFEALVVAQLDSIAKADLHLGSLDGPPLYIAPLPYALPS